MRLTAYIIKKDRRLFPYEVQYRYDTGWLRSRPPTCHMTLKRAERAAKRFTKTREPEQTLKSFSGDDGVKAPGPPPPRTVPRTVRRKSVS